jgi:tetratricopeptide (TPR) repeat protein
MQRFPLICFLFLSSALLRAETVLVLPFFNQSKSATLDWIGESVSETVRECLASGGVLVLDRDERLEAYRRLSLRPGALLTHASIIKVGELLDASRVIYGYYNVLPVPGAPVGPNATRGSLRITARILDLKRTRQGPEFAEMGALEELAALENHLGWQSLQFLAPKTAPSEQEFLRARAAVRVDAIESYVRGLLAATAEQRHRYFTQAVRLDEKYSQPCFRLGKTYWERKEYKIAAGWLARVSRADPHFLEAQFYLGLCRYQTADFDGAEKCFKLVADSVPLNEVYNNLGAAEVRLNLNGAAASFRKALEGDSADPDYHFNLGYALWREGKFNEAAESFRAALDRDPQDSEAATMLARAQKQDGPRPGEPKQGRERLKTNYEETVYRQLQAELTK